MAFDWLATTLLESLQAEFPFLRRLLSCCAFARRNNILRLNLHLTESFINPSPVIDSVNSIIQDRKSIS
jgi:hypothetical protein